MQLNLSPIASAGVGAAVIGVIILLYYFLEYLPDQHIREQSKMHDFIELEFIEDMNPATFEHYNDRWTKGFFAGMAPFFIIVIIAVRFVGGIGVPLGLISGGAIMITVFLGTNYMTKLQEIEAAGKGPSIPTMCYFAKHGPREITIRSAELKSQAELDATQKETLSSKACEIIGDMAVLDKIPFKDDAAKETFLAAVKTNIRARLDISYNYRYLCDGKYNIVLITRNKVNDMILPVKQKTLFKSFHINTDLMPMWSIFCETTKKLFETVTSKGTISWTTKQAGIILDIFDWADFWELITKGEFVTADKQTALVGHLVHLEEQNSVTRTELNKSKADRLGALEEVETKNMEDLYKALAELAENMIKQLAEANRPKSERMKVDYVLMVFVSFAMILFGLLLGLNQASGG